MMVKCENGHEFEDTANWECPFCYASASVPKEIQPGITIQGMIKYNFTCKKCDKKTSTTILEKAQFGLCNRCTSVI
jgi:hypothetical protein